MKKQILLLLCVFAFPLFGQQQDINIKVTAPDNVVAGNDFQVTVTFIKGKLKDYSRFSQELPEGFTAKNISSPNADFTFTDQRIRIIWLKLPDEPQIVVTYSVSVHERLSGTLNLGGTFAYVDEGERAYLNIADVKKVMVMPNPTIDQSLVVDISEFNKIQESDNVVAAEVPADQFASVVRQLPQIESNGIVYVSLLVKRPEGTNFLKLEETVPGGYSFESINAHGAVVSQSASVAKFVWMKPPAESNFMLKYRLVPILERTQEPLAIEGNLTYTEGGKTKVAGAKELEVNLTAMNNEQQAQLLQDGVIPTGLNEIAQNTATPALPTSTTLKKPAVSTAPKPAVKKSVRTHSKYTSSEGGSIIDVLALEAGSGVYFRVQVAAVRKPYFAKAIFAKYDLLRDVKQEKLEGWTKYTVGSFDSYQEADVYKDKVIAETPIGKAFVVAYRDGRRVAVNTVL